MRTIKARMGDSGWRCLKTDPPPLSERMFFIGNASGGRTQLVFRWPDKNGEPVYWAQGESSNYIVRDFQADVWYPGAPVIPGSFIAKIRGR